MSYKWPLKSNSGISLNMILNIKAWRLGDLELTSMASWNCSCSFLSSSAWGRLLGHTSPTVNIDSPLRIHANTCNHITNVNTLNLAAISMSSKVVRGPPLEYWPGGGGSFVEINIFVGKMGETNKWPQGLLEIQHILRWENKAFHLPCEINKNGHSKTCPSSRISNGGSIVGGCPTTFQKTEYSSRTRLSWWTM